MKTPKKPNIIKVNFPPPVAPSIPIGEKKEVIPDFILNFNTLKKTIKLTIPSDQMERFADFWQALLSANGIVCKKEEISR